MEYTKDQVFGQYKNMTKEELRKRLDKLQKERERIIYRDGQIFKSEFSIDSEIDYIISILSS